MNLGYTSYRRGPVLTIIGNDLDAGATFNAEVAPGQGIIMAGRLMTYAAQLLAPSAVGTDAFGVLADDIDTGTGATNLPVMVYRRGIFLRQEIEYANQLDIPAAGTVDVALRALGIHLVLSYEAYDGLTPLPTAAQASQDALNAAAAAAGGKPIPPSLRSLEVGQQAADASTEWLAPSEVSGNVFLIETPKEQPPPA